MKALISNYTVVEISDSNFPVADPLFWRNAPEGCQVGWIYDPNNDTITAPVLPQKSMNEVISKLRKMVNEHLEQVACERGFEGKEDLLSYQSSSINLFLNDASTFNTWRDNVWQTANQILNQVQSEQISRPTKEEFIAMLPTITWP